MGTAKILLEYDGEPLVRRAARVALRAGCDPVHVVVAARSDRIRRALADLAVTVVVNEAAPEGIGTSIAAGVRALPHDVGRMLLMLCDQPLVTSDHLVELIERATATGSAVAASRYSGTVGVPAVFDRSVFTTLAALSGDRGCKGVIHAQADQAVFLDCPDAAFDVDTPSDYGRLTDARG